VSKSQLSTRETCAVGQSGG